MHNIHKWFIKKLFANNDKKDFSDREEKFCVFFIIFFLIIGFAGELIGFVLAFIVAARQIARNIK